MERINVRVESQLKQRLELEAKAKGVSPSAIVRQLLEEHYRQPQPRENCHQLAQRLGILGSIKGLPADLSTNPDHMEGFGRD
jgi:Ribbon-helix-helix protein, copG family